MKSSLIRPALALTLALGLSACGGGGKAEFTVAGTVQNLVYPGLVLTTNGTEISVAPPATSGADVTFTFPNKLEYGDEYFVQIKQHPQHQTCNFPGAGGVNQNQINKDTAGRLARINVIVQCGVNTYAIGGKVTGLTAGELVLANGSTGGTVTLPKDATSYTMPAKVAYGITYGVTVIEQPTGLTCTVANPTGIMGDADVTNIDVSCVPQT